MSIEQHTTYALRNAPLKMWPYPHFYIENVFPSGYYEQLLDWITSNTKFADSEFANRNFAEDSAIPGLEFMKSHAFLKHILAIFQPYLPKEAKLQVSRDIRLIRDGIGYKIGPHTDAAWKMVSLLFYLPHDNRYADYGTSIYVPRDPAFTCEGGPHYPFEPFEKVITAPYHANSCLGFWKTNTSFHGVEPIPVQFNRDVLLYNIYSSKPPK